MGRLGVLGRMPPKRGKGWEKEFVWEMLPGSTGREWEWETGKAGRANDCAGYCHITGNWCSTPLPRPHRETKGQATGAYVPRFPSAWVGLYSHCGLSTFPRPRKFLGRDKDLWVGGQGTGMRTVIGDPWSLSGNPERGFIV